MVTKKGTFSKKAWAGKVLAGWTESWLRGEFWWDGIQFNKLANALLADADLSVRKNQAENSNSQAHEKNNRKCATYKLKSIFAPSPPVKPRQALS